MAGKYLDRDIREVSAAHHTNEGGYQIVFEAKNLIRICTAGSITYSAHALPIVGRRRHRQNPECQDFFWHFNRQSRIYQPL